MTSLLVAFLLLASPALAFEDVLSCEDEAFVCPADDSVTSLFDFAPKLDVPKTISFVNGGNTVVEIELKTGRVKTSLPYYEASYAFWMTLADAMPDVRASICKGAHYD